MAIEVIFGRPGLGAFLVARIQQKDVPSIQGVVGDFLASMTDPGRLRQDRGKIKDTTTLIAGEG